MIIRIIRNEAFKIRTAAELQSERIRKEAAELAAKVKEESWGEKSRMKMSILMFGSKKGVVE